MILVAGGDEDHNILSLLERMRRRGIEAHSLLVGLNTHPRLTWDLPSDKLHLGGRLLKPDGVFIRQDIFSNLSDPRPEVAERAAVWFTTVSAWAMAHENISMFNRNWSQQRAHKPLQLYLAHKIGFKIPGTLVTNDLLLLDKLILEQQLVVKPVNGGGYCEELTPLLKNVERKNGVSASPAIIQPRLVLPEIRIFVIGVKSFSFSIVYDAVDSRTAECEVQIIQSVSQEISQKMKKLMELLGMNFGAADFKTCPKTGDLLFLEINSNPMFSRFDQIAGGTVCDAIIDFLAAPEKRIDSSLSY